MILLIKHKDTHLHDEMSMCHYNSNANIQNNKRRTGFMPENLKFLPLLTICLLLISCSEPESAVQPTPEVSVMVAEPRDIPVYTEFVGKTVSSRRIEIRSRVEGFLEKRL